MGVLHFFFFFFFFLPYHFFLHCLENRTKPMSTPYDGRCWWDSNLRTPACKSPALPLCYGLHLPSSVLQRPSNIRNNTGVHFRSLTWVYCIYHQVVCISYHVNQEPHLGVLHLPSSVLQRPSSNIRNNTGVYFRSLTWVYFICHQVFCISYHGNQGSHMVYCICQ